MQRAVEDKRQATSGKRQMWPAGFAWAQPGSMSLIKRARQGRWSCLSVLCGLLFTACALLLTAYCLLPLRAAHSAEPATGRAVARSQALPVAQETRAWMLRQARARLSGGVIDESSAPPAAK